MIRRILLSRRRLALAERGAILVLSAIVMVALVGVAALALDIAGMSRMRQHVQDSVDAAAIAGAHELPDVNTARQKAVSMAAVNGLAIQASDVTVSCQVGADPTTGYSTPDPVLVSASCDPTNPGPYGCRRQICVGPCVSSPTQRCNTLQVKAQATRTHSFAQVIGVPTGRVSGSAAACWNACGGYSTALVDIVAIVDRSGSMTATDLANVKGAINSLLDHLNPEYQHVALGVLGFSSANVRLCPNGMQGLVPTRNFGGNPVGLTTWVPVGLSSDYNLASSDLRKTVSCLGGDTQGWWGTDLGTPVTEAQKELVSGRARPKAQKVIVLFTDGAANEPSSQPNPCDYAAQSAQAAKAAGTEIYTIGFGVSASDTCDGDNAPSPYGPVWKPAWWFYGSWARPPVTQLLADMATQPTFDESGCVPAENADGDHFYCESKGTDLAPLFRRIAMDIAGASHLVDPSPN